MEKFVIHGGKPLVGEVEISGAKNAAVAILPATILAGGKCVIENLPNISDVSASVDILSAMGAHVRVINKHTLEIDTAHIVCPRSLCWNRWHRRCRCPLWRFKSRIQEIFQTSWKRCSGWMKMCPACSA